MFEVGFTELLLIFALALVVLGPRRLPELAAKVGRWVGKARAMARQLREQLDQEVIKEEAEARRQQQPPPPPPLNDTEVDPHGKPYYPPDHHAAQPPPAAEQSPATPAAGDEPIEPSQPQQTAHERSGT